MFQKWTAFVFTESWSRDQLMQRAYLNFSKETQNRFWIHKFPQETPGETPEPIVCNI